MLCLITLLLLTPWQGQVRDENANGHPQVISHGEKVDLGNYLVQGRFVVFDFYADWCGPCRKWAPILEKIARDYPEKVLLYKVDIGNWGTDVAIQYEIERIPYVMLYNEQGKRTDHGHPRGVVDKLNKRAKRQKW